jgi:hypothetical protein
MRKEKNTYENEGEVESDDGNWLEMTDLQTGLNQPRIEK